MRPAFRAGFDVGSAPDRAVALHDRAERLAAAGRLAAAEGACSASLRLLGHHRSAERLLRRALDRAERTLGARDLEVARICNLLGILYKYMGRPRDAAPVYRRALRIAGEEGPMAPAVYHNLAGLEHSRGRYREAEPLARRGIALRPRGDPARAADEAALGFILAGLGRHSEAERLFLRALKRFRGNPFETAVNLNNLVAVYHARGETRRALPLYRRATAIQERLLGRGAPDTALTPGNRAAAPGF